MGAGARGPAVGRDVAGHRDRRTGWPCSPAHGTTAVSIGVQSFLDAEAHAAGRPQRRADVDRLWPPSATAGVPVLNIDLIYGIHGQTPATWPSSLDAGAGLAARGALPLPAVRPAADRAGPARRADRGPDWDAAAARALPAGPGQLRAPGTGSCRCGISGAPDVAATAAGRLRCQDDGMVGLGCGARSYTAGLHYSFDYAVSVGEVRGGDRRLPGRPPGTSATPRSGSPSTRPSSAAGGW